MGMNYMHMYENVRHIGGGRTEHLSMDTQWIQMHPGCLKDLWE